MWSFTNKYLKRRRITSPCRGQGWAWLGRQSLGFLQNVRMVTQDIYTMSFHGQAQVCTGPKRWVRCTGTPTESWFSGLTASQTNGEKELHIFFRNHVLELSWDRCTTKEGQQSLVVLTRSYWALLAFLCNDSIMILHDMLGRFSRVLLVWIPTMNLINALAMNFTHRWRRARPVIRFLLPFWMGVYLVITSGWEGIDCFSSRSFVFVYFFFS